MLQIVQSPSVAAHNESSPARRVRMLLTPRKLADLCDLTENAVYKWDRAKSKGGLGGLIPAQFQARILAVAEADGLPLTARDLIAEARP